MSRRLSENSICAIKSGEIGEVYGWKTLAILPILSIQMLFSDSLLGPFHRLVTILRHASPLDWEKLDVLRPIT